MTFTSPPRRRHAARGRVSPRNTRYAARVVMRRRAIFEAAAVLALVTSLTVAPVVHADAHAATVDESGVQSLTVSAETVQPKVVRGGIKATPAAEAYARSGTNEDWAKLVLVFGNWPVTEQNTTVMLRWMRQENGVDNWFNRNNPMNNGYGSGGGSGLGSYDNLTIAAQMAAENLKAGSGYVAIVKAFEKGDSADAVARAIWASPWSSSHYANGTHWSTRPVTIVKAPEPAWQ